MPTLYLYEFIGLIFGLLFGSFLNVCIYRLPKHESVVYPHSSCPNCKASIRWYDNIPILSFMLLRARCRECHQKISWQYPLVELALGLWFATVVAFTSRDLFGFFGAVPSFVFFPILTIEAVSIAVLGFLLIGLIVMDWETHLLPDAFTLTGIAIGLLLVSTQAIFLAPHEGDVVLNTTRQLRLGSPGSSAAHGNIFLTGTEALVLGRLAAILGAAGLLLLIRWTYQAVRHREGLGLGDVKLVAMIAAFLGFWPAILSLFLGVLAATAYALLLLGRRRANALTRLPLGSFIGAGGLIAALFGNRLIDIYTALLR